MGDHALAVVLLVLASAWLAFVVVRWTDRLVQRYLAGRSDDDDQSPAD